MDEDLSETRVLGLSSLVKQQNGITFLLLNIQLKIVIRKCYLGEAIERSQMYAVFI
jgi:hypothetical protein